MAKKTNKEPIMGMYFPSEYANYLGELLINFSIDIDKFINDNDKFIKINSKGKKYLKGCIKKNRVADKDGNLYYAFHNTYEHTEPEI